MEIQFFIGNIRLQAKKIVVILKMFAFVIMTNILLLLILKNHLNIFETKNMILRNSINVHGDNLAKIIDRKKNSYEV